MQIGLKIDEIEACAIIAYQLVFVNLDFRNGDEKLGLLDQPLQSYSQIYCNIFQQKMVYSGLLQVR